MSRNVRKLADKFFNNQCSAAEAGQVLKWLDTPEGQEYLGEKMDDDLTAWDDDAEADESDDKHPPNLKELNPERHFGGIMATIEQLERAGYKRKRDVFAPILKAAAAILVVAAASVFVYVSAPGSGDEEQVAETVLTTSADQQREVTLGDGTVVHLNEQSTVTVSGGYMKDNREVLLEGEAYFEVAHNEELPFIIHTDHSEVEVLGTSFNVKSAPSEGRVEVAVLEGRVSFRDSRGEDPERVILQKGEYGYLDIAARQITTEDFGVENYLAWKNGEFLFDELSMERVCVQLVRFYDMSCKFQEDAIKGRKLTANFPSDDPENTLSVIASSLHLEYEYETGDRRVVWKNAEESDASF